MLTAEIRPLHSTLALCWVIHLDDDTPPVRVTWASDRVVIPTCEASDSELSGEYDKLGLIEPLVERLLRDHRACVTSFLCDPYDPAAGQVILSRRKRFQAVQ